MLPRTITRQTLRYYGGKWRIAPWIISHFPKHVCYVEPYAGGASVLLRKHPSTIEAYNDMDDCVVNFFRVLRDQPDALAHAIELTPWSREELKAAREPCADAVEWARRRYVSAFQSRTQTQSHLSPGWRFQRSAEGKYVVPLWNDITHLYAAAARMKLVHIENDDALAIIDRYDTDETLFYVDPPYMAETRSYTWSTRAYVSEMDDAAHERLANTLHNVRGYVALSGYDTPLYRELYKGWTSDSCYAIDGGGSRRTELLWLNPQASSCARQPSLFGAG